MSVGVGVVAPVRSGDCDLLLRPDESLLFPKEGRALFWPRLLLRGVVCVFSLFALFALLHLSDGGD